jgi:hypothetical protein
MRGVAPEFAGAGARLQLELLIYDRLPPARQREVTGPGLTLMWSEMPAAVRSLFAARLRGWLQPGIRDETLRRGGLFMRFDGQHFLFRWLLPPPHTPSFREMRLTAPPATVSQPLVGRPLPMLIIEDAEGKIQRLRPADPFLLYVAPAWPRPVVTREETFADLKALQQMRAGDPADTSRVLVVGTEATATELRRWWQERGLTLPPLALAPDAAQRLGVGHLPLAIVMDRGGRIAWVKEGYEPGDEEEWRRQLARQAE